MKEKIAKIILEETRKNYDLIAPQFSETRSRLWADLDYFKKYLKENDKILDVGCGNGRLYELFGGQDVAYLGVDNSAKLISEAQKKYPKIANNFQAADILDLKFDSANFDKIFCIAVFHHLPSAELRLKALKNLKKILKKDGFIFLINWNLFNKRYRPYIIKYSCLKFFSKVIIPGVRTNDLDFKDTFIPWKKTAEKKAILRYCHAFTLRELIRLAKKANLKPVAKFYTKNGKISSLFKAHNSILICKNSCD